MKYPSKGPTIAILIPCYNEAFTIEKCLNSWLEQSRPADQILVIDDGSTDGTDKILKKITKRKKFRHAKKYRNLQIIRIQHRGNKSFVQQAGLEYVHTDVFIATDADTLAHPDFIDHVHKAFQDPEIQAFAGYVQSLKGNWLTALREIEYAIGQDVHKQAQHKLNFLFVIPGCAGAFRTAVFKEYIHFDHDTLTEDLDFTYILNENSQSIYYDTKAIVYTQDPATLRSYIRQVSRWFSGGYQNLLKHSRNIDKPNMALELSLMYIEGLVFSLLILVMPLVNIHMALMVYLFYTFYNITIGIYSGIRRRRLDLVVYSPLMLLLNFINAGVFVWKFILEVIFRKHNTIWFHPERRVIT